MNSEEIHYVESEIEKSKEPFTSDLMTVDGSFSECKSIALVGPSGSGKTLFLNQLILNASNGINKYIRKGYIDVLKDGSVIFAQEILRSINTQQLGAEAMSIAHEIAHINIGSYSFTKNIAEKLEYLSNHPLFSEKMHKLPGKELQKYMLMNCSKLLNSENEISKLELSIPFTRTIGISRASFSLDSNIFQLVDCSGVQCERYKWNDAIRGASATIYFVSLEDFDYSLFEISSESIDRIEDSFKTFEELSESPDLNGQQLFIVFTNLSGLERRLKRDPSAFVKRFPEYKGNKECAKECAYYLASLFEKKSSRIFIRFIGDIADREFSHEVITQACSFL